MPLRVLDLFSGIGGFSIGLERAGMQTVAFCELHSFCQAVLRKNWPKIPIYDDIRTLTANRLATDGITDISVIAGGFPCQDISVAGKGTGLAGERSGLWREYARLIGELRPRYVIVENVAALLYRGLGEVLGDLATLGYDAEWHCIPASYVGAPHRRDRIWIVAYPDSKSTSRSIDSCIVKRGQAPASEGSMDIGDTSCSGARSRMENVADTRRQSSQIPITRQLSAIQVAEWNSWWQIEPSVGRVVDGIPSRLDRLKALGNAVVPQIPEMIGRAIINAEGI